MEIFYSSNLKPSDFFFLFFNLCFSVRLKIEFMSSLQLPTHVCGSHNDLNITQPGFI